MRKKEPYSGAEHYKMRGKVAVQIYVFERTRKAYKQEAERLKVAAKKRNRKLKISAQKLMADLLDKNRPRRYLK
jgi:hypothetical protein